MIVEHRDKLELVHVINIAMVMSHQLWMEHWICQTKQSSQHFNFLIIHKQIQFRMDTNWCCPLFATRSLSVSDYNSKLNWIYDLFCHRLFNYHFEWMIHTKIVIVCQIKKDSKCTRCTPNWIKNLWYCKFIRVFWIQYLSFANIFFLSLSIWFPIS